MNSPKSYRVVTSLCAIFALAAMLAPLAFAQGKQDFTFINKSGKDVLELYVSPASSDDWEEDILGKDVLPNGESTTIHFSRREKAAKWDIKAIDENHKEHKQYNLNLLEISEITVRDNGDGTWYWSWK